VGQKCSKHGLQDWSVKGGGSIYTYKFQSPYMDLSKEKKLCLTIDLQGRKLLHSKSVSPVVRID